METLASRICTLGKKCSLIPLQKWPWLASWVAPRSHTRLGEGLPRKWWTDGHLARILKDGSIYDTFRCIFYAAHGFHVIYRLDFKSWGFRILNSENLDNAKGFQDSKSSGYRILMIQYPQDSKKSSNRGLRILDPAGKSHYIPAHCTCKPNPNSLLYKGCKNSKCDAMCKNFNA